MSFLKEVYSKEDYLNGTEMSLSPEDLREKERYDKFKAGEYSIYKEFHKAILVDEGIPSLKKTSFSIPGYRQILSNKEKEMYTIDNEAHLKANKEQFNKQNVMQDIVPDVEDGLEVISLKSQAMESEQ